MRYFTCEPVIEEEARSSVCIEINKMIESGTIKPMIIVYLVTMVQMLVMEGSRFTLADASTIQKIKRVLMAIFDDEIYCEQAVKQIFSFCLLSSARGARNQNIRQEIDRFMEMAQTELGKNEGKN